MSSGRRECVMIFCTSPISRLYLDPIEHYEPDEIHVFVSNRDDSLSSIEREAYDSSRSGIECKNVIEHNIDTSDYNDVLGEIIEILNDLHRRFGDDLDVFINISSGTPEFSAAGMFASMLPHSAIAFKVDADYSMTKDGIFRIIDKLNDSVKVSEPERVTGLKNDRPDDEMIVFLRIVSDILQKTKYPKYRVIIDKLKEADAWSYDPDRKSGYGKTSLEEKEERYLKRHYIAIAMENGWMERPSQNRMVLTESGKAYISVYAPDIGVRGMAANNVCRSTPRYDSMEMDYRFCECDSMMEPPFESNTVTFGKKDKRYTFTINMDQHR